MWLNFRQSNSLFQSRGYFKCLHLELQQVSSWPLTFFYKGREMGLKKKGKTKEEKVRFWQVLFSCTLGEGTWCSYCLLASTTYSKYQNKVSYSNVLSTCDFYFQSFSFPSFTTETNAYESYIDTQKKLSVSDEQAMKLLIAIKLQLLLKKKTVSPKVILDSFSLKEKKNLS